jgi:hypothetical protein
VDLGRRLGDVGPVVVVGEVDTGDLLKASLVEPEELLVVVDEGAVVGAVVDVAPDWVRGVALIV